MEEENEEEAVDKVDEAAQDEQQPEASDASSDVTRENAAEAAEAKEGAAIGNAGEGDASADEKSSKLPSRIFRKHGLKRRPAAAAARR